MRIISGKYKGFKFPVLKGHTLRPTTDVSKEALFSFLQNNIELEGVVFADIFSGTGNISLEFFSRGALYGKSVDSNKNSVAYIAEIKKKLQVDNWDILLQDSLNWISKETRKFDLIFADPPYDWQGIHVFVKTLLNKGIINKNGLLVVEHKAHIIFNEPEFMEKKIFGDTAFSLFCNQ